MITAHILTRNNVNVSGRRDGQPMVFARLGCDQHTWRFVAPAFADDYRIVPFDNVRSGTSCRARSTMSSRSAGSST